MEKTDKILHFMNNFYLPFINSLTTTSSLNESSLTEKHIHIIWNEFCLGKTFSSLQNQQISIINTGQWNLEAGPDFKDAEILIDKQKYYGKIELHLSPELWYTHGHHWNPQYDDIILHVVWQNPNKLAIPSSIPIIELEPLMKEKLAAAQKYDDYPRGKKIPYDKMSHQIKNLNNDNLKIIFQAAGLSKILKKSHQLKKQILTVGLEQTFYQNFLEIMGYKNNRQQFLELAQAATIEKLSALDDNQQRQALLWGISNLLPQILPSYEINKELKNEIEQLWQLWWKLRQGDEPLIKWSRQAQRPVNSPERRLIAAHIFFAKFNYDIHSIIKTIKELILEPKRHKEFIELLNEKSLWQNFYNFIKKTKKPLNLLGKSRCDDLLINLFIPFIIALEDDKNLASRTSLINSLLQIPKLQDNIKLSLASNLFFIPPKRKDYVITNAIEQQGLLQLFNDYQNFSGDQQAFWAEFSINLEE